MRCRSLVLNEITNKQNIVWFGSYGINKNYILVKFTEPPKTEDWAKSYMNYYIINSIRPNLSEVWGECALICGQFVCSEEAIINSGTEPKYYKYDSTKKEYVVINEMPKDWKTNWADYWIIDFQQNTNTSYDPSVQYYLHNNKLSANNYSTEQEGVRNSLIQRLSVIKGELWYKASYGLPLTEKIKNKGIYDSIIINIITEHPDVVNLTNYVSEIKDRKYYFSFIVYTVYNTDIQIEYVI